MKRIGEIVLLVMGCIFICSPSYGTILTPDFPKEGVVDPDNNNFIDPDVDYSEFMGRVTDKDDTGRILKVKTENNNSKFLKAGDRVQFKVNNHERMSYCSATVRAVEDFYFSVYVQDFTGCWGTERYFPRGLQLNFKSDLMAKRVFEASEYRKLLILRKEGFLNQLNEINNFLWTYDQQKLQTAADYDKQINELRRQKQLALDNMIQRKQESLMLQNELVQKLDSLDESLDHYRIERQEYMLDRWVLDNDSGLPYGRRPQKYKKP